MEPSHATGAHDTRTQPAEQQPARVAPPQPAAPAHTAEPTVGNLVLPLSVATRSDVSRGLRELKKLDDYFHQAGLRSGQVSTMPALSRTLDGLASANQLNLLHADARKALVDFLSRLRSHAPVVHMSFPSEPSPTFLAKILEWFRREVHPFVVLHVGLQPELVAGCMVRTTNKMMDFSFRKRFEESKAKLIASLHALDSVPERTEIADANATVAPEERLV